MRTRRNLRAHRDRLVLVALLAAVAGGAQAQNIPPDGAAVGSPVRKPALGIRKAQILGAAAGLALGASPALWSRSCKRPARNHRRSDYG